MAVRLPNDSNGDYGDVFLIPPHVASEQDVKENIPSGSTSSGESGSPHLQSELFILYVVAFGLPSEKIVIVTIVMCFLSRLLWLLNRMSMKISPAGTLVLVTLAFKGNSLYIMLWLLGLPNEETSNGDPVDYLALEEVPYSSLDGRWIEC